MVKLGLLGFSDHPWPSLGRTRQFYLDALQQKFTLVMIDDLLDGDLPAELGAILSFSGGRCWQLDPHPACPLILAVHGGAVVDYQRLWNLVGRLEQSDVLLVNCRSDAAILRTMFEGDPPILCHLPLPVDTTVFLRRPKSDCHEVLPLKGAHWLVGHVGRLLPQKNPHRFLQFLAQLKTRLAPQKVAGVIIGNYWVDYPVLPYVTAAYPKHIVALAERLGVKEDLRYFSARLSDEELARCYGAMDLLYHPTNSLDENFGYAPVEAMACGTPVIGTAYGGLKDTVRSHQTGYLMSTWVTPGGIRVDWPSGLEHSVALLADAARLDQVRQAAADWATSNFTHARCAGLLCDAVEQAIYRRRQGGGKRVRAAPGPKALPRAPYLPELDQSWEDYAPAVAHYVSGAVPTIGPRTQFHLAAPLLDTDDGAVALDDPAWPCRYALSATDRERLVGWTQESTDVPLGDPTERDLAQSFIERGLLITSAPSP
jgi:glycosyltransferase involved in cell wall biosynthesis